MKTHKLFLTSLGILALALGFFLGTLWNCERIPQKTEASVVEKKEPPAGKIKKNKAPMNVHMLDSLLQVTPEQKALLESNRQKGDSTFKFLRQQKHNAEKSLRIAIESGDSNLIENVKVQILEAEKAMLNHRVDGMIALSKILTPEQMAKFREFPKNFKGPHMDPKLDGKPFPKEPPHPSQK